MKRRLLMYGAPLALAAALVVYGLVGRERALASLTRVATDQAVVPVQVISPQKGPATRPLVLPGTVRAWYEAPIFAQVAGYVSSWNEDLGATVKAGQLLATIE
jgi:membrane fusion protein, multidrug efflux system